MLVADEEAADTFRMAGQPVSHLQSDRGHVTDSRPQEPLYVEFQPSYKLEEYLNPNFKLGVIDLD